MVIEIIVMDVTRESTNALLKKNVQVMSFSFYMITHSLIESSNHTLKNNKFIYTNLTSISVDCQWSEWSSSECTAPCGSGTLTKERTSKLPKEKLNETPSCMHKLVLVESCNTQECPGKLNRTFEIQEVTEMLNVIISNIFLTYLIIFSFNFKSTVNGDDGRTKHAIVQLD